MLSTLVLGQESKIKAKVCKHLWQNVFIKLRSKIANQHTTEINDKLLSLRRDMFCSLLSLIKFNGSKTIATFVL